MTLENVVGPQLKKYFVRKKQEYQKEKLFERVGSQGLHWLTFIASGKTCITKIFVGCMIQMLGIQVSAEFHKKLV